MGGRRAFWVLAVAMAAALVALFEPSVETPAESDASEGPATAPPTPAETPLPQARVSRTPAAVRPARAGSATQPAATSPPFHGFCADDARPHESYRRPSLMDPLVVRSDELVDRTRRALRADDTSAPLKHGLRLLLSRDEPERAIAALRDAPDRVADGFDFAGAAAALSAVRAIGEGNLAQAAHYAAWGVELAPHDSALHGLRALVAWRRHEPATRRRALARARALDPGEPVFALELGRALAETHRLAEAARHLDAYLKDAPDDVTVAQLRARLEAQRQIQRDYHTTTHEGVTLLAAPGLGSSRPAGELAEQIAGALDEAAALTGTTRRQELTAVVYSERAELLASSCVPAWTEGVFDGVLRLYAASLEDPERARQVIRHEVLHAQLRPHAPRAPQWFQEGLAQHFAQERSRAQQRDFRFMVKHATYIPFASLDGSFLVIDESKDARLAYHQSLAMVELILQRTGPEAVPRAIRYLRRDDPAGLLEHLTQPHPLTGDDLLAYLQRRTR